MFKKIWNWYSNDFGAVKQIITMFVLSAIFVGGQVWYSSTYEPENESALNILTIVGVLAVWVVVLLIANKSKTGKIRKMESMKTYDTPEK